MIYGLNFNLTHIPVAAKRLFASRLNADKKAVGADKACHWLLQGVCQSQAEVRAMIVQAGNGHREFHIVVRSDWMGLYTH